ncbi:hypothetical protein LZ30DRAFT_472592 [Colletotrichum cereale]|nr:hypothetical protein LZ30DRAFT_472592 [Colletotrichum cereale]
MCGQLELDSEACVFPPESCNVRDDHGEQAHPARDNWRTTNDNATLPGVHCMLRTGGLAQSCRTCPPPQDLLGHGMSGGAFAKPGFHDRRNLRGGFWKASQRANREDVHRDGLVRVMSEGLRPGRVLQRGVPKARFSSMNDRGPDSGWRGGGEAEGVKSCKVT